MMCNITSAPETHATITVQRREYSSCTVTYICPTSRCHIIVKKINTRFASWREIATLLQIDIETCDDVENVGEMEHRWS